MKKRIITIGLRATIFILLIMVVFFKPYQGLYVHVQDSSWTDITVDSQNLSKPVTLSSRTGHSTVKVDQISHGVYKIRWRFEDGKEFWAALFHYDAGVRQRLDVYIERVPGTDKIKVREYANKLQLIFQGEKTVNETSQKEPFELDWI